MQQINPILCMDYPDPDVIRVGDVYYMVKIGRASCRERV